MKHPETGKHGFRPKAQRGRLTGVELAARFALLPGTRQIFDMRVESGQTSCGWGVPILEHRRDRDTLVKYHAQQDPQEWAAKYGARDRSIDGLPTRPTDRYIAGEPQTAPRS